MNKYTVSFNIQQQRLFQHELIDPGPTVTPPAPDHVGFVKARQMSNALKEANWMNLNGNSGGQHQRANSHTCSQPICLTLQSFVLKADHHYTCKSCLL